MFNKIFSSSKSISPYKDKNVNFIYNILFCDDLLLYKNNSNNPDVYPWNILFSNEFDQEALNKIIKDESIESRVKILAYRKLQNKNIVVEVGRLLGVIAEVGLDDGLDTLAVFKDYTARYINYSGRMTIWETQDNIFNSKADELFKYSEIIVNNIGPWDKSRLTNPKKGNVRLTFLVSDGIYFGEGSIDVILNDKMAGAVFKLSADILQYLVERSLNGNENE